MLPSLLNIMPTQMIRSVHQQVHNFVPSPVWLERDLVIARHLTEVFLQLSEEFLVALCLIQGHERMDVGKLPPCDGLSEDTAVRHNDSKAFHVTPEENWKTSSCFYSPWALMSCLASWYRSPKNKNFSLLYHTSIKHAINFNYLWTWTSALTYGSLTRGIMLWTKERSLFSRRFIYLTMLVSEW